MNTVNVRNAASLCDEYVIGAMRRVQSQLRLKETLDSGLGSQSPGR